MLEIESDSELILVCFSCVKASSYSCRGGNCVFLARNQWKPALVGRLSLNLSNFVPGVQVQHSVLAKSERYLLCGGVCQTKKGHN